MEVDIDYAHLFRIEAGQYTPSDDSLMKMLDAYKIVDPSEKLRIFNLARLTPSYKEIINEAGKHFEGNPQDFVGAFYRKETKKKNTKK